MSKNKPLKHNCSTCGEKDPSKFRDRLKRICSTCQNKINRNRVADDFKVMTPEEQKAYIDAPIVLSTPRSVNEAVGYVG